MKYNKFKLYLHFCVLLFVILLSAILLYAFGYQIDEKTGSPIQAGGLVIKTPIKNVTVYQNGKAIKTNDFISDLITDFIKLENLRPDKYNIEIKKDEYQTWQKNIEIKPGQVEKFENVILLKNKYEKDQILEETKLSDYEKTWLSKSEKQIAYLNKIEQGKEIGLIDLEQKSNKKILSDKQIALMGEVQNLFWIEDSSLLAIESKYGEKTSVQIISLNDNKVYTLNEEISSTILQQKNRSELNINGDFVVFKEENALYSFNYKTKEKKKIIENIETFDIQGNNIYFFKTSDSEKNIYKIEINSSTGRDIKFAKKPEEYDSSKSFEAQEQNNRLLLLSSDSLYFIDKDSTSEKIGFNIKDAFFFQESKRVIFYNDNEIWVYYTEDKTYQPNHQKGERELITRFSGTLEDIYMYKDEEHVLYKENGMIKFAELDGRDNRNIQNISEETSGTAIYSRNKNSIYEAEENGLFVINLEN